MNKKNICNRCGEKLKESETTYRNTKTYCQKCYGFLRFQEKLKNERGKHKRGRPKK